VPRASIKRGQLGEIPVFHSDADGPTRAGLMFRVGRGDESAPDGGITHLVEHLALYRVGQQPFEYNGVVDTTWTGFWVTGTAAEAASFLTDVVRHLGDLPLDRLEHEQRVLRDEGANRPGSVFDHHAWLRYGLRGAGLAHLDEMGLYRLGPADVAAWATRWFNAGNAALVWTGSKLPRLSLELPPGPRRTPIVPEELIAEPTWAVDGPNLVAASFATPRTSAVAAALRILTKRLQQRLRYELGVSYDISLSYQPLSATIALASIAATTSLEHADDVRDAFAAVIANLRTDGPTTTELATDVAMMRGEEQPFAAIAEASRMAAQELVGAPPETRDELEQNARAVAPEDARAGFDAVATRMILTLPPEVPPPDSGFAIPPIRSPGTVAGRRFIDVREGAFGHATEYPELVVGPTGIALAFPDESGIRVPWETCAGVIHSRDGSVSVLDPSGAYVTVQAEQWWDGEAALALVNASVRPELVVRLPRDPSMVAPRPRISNTSLNVATFGSLLLAITAAGAFGATPDRREWLQDGPNTLTVLAGAGLLGAAFLLPAMAYGARRARPWARPAAIALIALIAGASIPLVAGGGSPGLLLFPVFAAAYAWVFVQKSRRRDERSKRAADSAAGVAGDHDRQIGSSASTQAQTVLSTNTRRLWFVIGLIVFLVAALGFTSMATRRPPAPSDPALALPPSGASGAHRSDPPEGFVKFAAHALTECGGPRRLEFAVGAAVWWAAQLPSDQPVDAQLRWTIQLDGRVIDRSRGPTVEPANPWDCLYAFDPIAVFGPGVYRVEVWDDRLRNLLSVGQFEVTGGPSFGATPQDPATTPLSTPSASFVPIAGPQGSRMAFDARGLADCEAAGTTTFGNAQNVYWSAQLADPQDAGKEIVWLVYVDGDARSSGRKHGPSGGGRFSCVVGGPIRTAGPGVYWVEIWDARVDAQLAAGSFLVTGPD
jgi:zinc protease